MSHQHHHLGKLCAYPWPPKGGRRWQRQPGKKLFAHLAQAVEDLRAWVKEILTETDDPKPSFTELCELSNQLLSLAKDFTALAVLVTRAAQESHSQKKK